MLKKLPKNIDQPAPVSPEKEMSFLDHLEELRSHLIKGVIGIAAFAILTFMFEKYVFKYIVMAPTQDFFFTYRFFCSLGDSLCISPTAFEVVPREMGEQFFTSLKVSFFLGFIASFPYVFYQFWSFIKPGLYPKEQKAAKGIVTVCSLLFMTGVLFGYFVISPFAINFLAGYSVSETVTNSTSLASYVNYMVMFTIPTGIVFELPILVYFLSKIGMLTPAFMKKYRRHAFILILILAAIITPPDVVTQFLIGVPVFILYELSIFISARAERKRAEELA